MTETVAAVVVAAGRGERAGGSVPKQYRPIAGEPMIRAALHAFVGHPRIDFVQPVINPSDRDSYDCAIAGLKDLLPPVAGGATRQAWSWRGWKPWRHAAPDSFLSMMPLVLLSARR